MPENLPPLYDPDVHVDPAQVVRAELWCSCGGCWRQVDPVSHVAPQVVWFSAKHSGTGHGPVDPVEAVAEREARREAAYRSRGEQHLYALRERADIDAITPSTWTPKAGS